MEKIPYDLLAKYFCGECTEAECKKIESWRDALDSNREAFLEIKRLLSAASSDPDEMEAARIDVYDNIKNVRNRNNQIRHAFSWLYAVAGAAASAALILLFANPFGNQQVAKNVSAEVVVRTLPGQRSQLTLPDGTQIWLNSATTLTYPSDYGPGNRHVTLREGEAYFDVAKSKEKGCFVLDADGIGVKVYGTQFDVSRYDEDKEYSIVLQSGHIEILDEAMEPVSEMLPGQKYTYDVTTGNGSLVAYDVSDEGIWRFGELRITRETLQGVVKKMEKWYGVKINLDSNSTDMYWMTVKTESLREMLCLIDKIHPISYTVIGNEVEISDR